MIEELISKLTNIFFDNEEILKTELMIDLVVTFDPQLIRRHFNCFSPEMFSLLSKAMVRSHLEYANSL